MSPTSPTTSPTRPARNAYIDTLRGVSIFGVVCVHFAGSFVTTDAHAWSPSFLLGLTLNQLFGFAVPMFVFLSGLLAGLSQQTGSLADYYAGRARRIAWPYLVASISAFFLLNHYEAWSRLPDIATRLSWLAERLLFKGVEPTLYFIPLILQLYLLQPALKALPGWVQRLVPSLSVDIVATTLALMLFVLHVTLGVLCDRGVLNYYVWGRPNALFWVFYFFAGLHFRSIAGLLSRRAIAIFMSIATSAAIAAMVWNFLQLLDHTRMGDHFQFNRLDFAYVRPEMLIYDAGVVLTLGFGVTLGWSVRPGLLSYLGRFTLEIYLWHILALYFAVWRYSEALESCRNVPELIVIICLATALILAAAADAWQRARALAATYRLALVRRA